MYEHRARSFEGYDLPLRHPKKRLKEDDLRMAIYSLRASSPGRSAFLAPLLIRPRRACSRAR